MFAGSGRRATGKSLGYGLCSDAAPGAKPLDHVPWLAVLFVGFGARAARATDPNCRMAQGRFLLVCRMPDSGERTGTHECAVHAA